MDTPSAVSTSALPVRPEMARLPCLTTGTPAPATRPVYRLLLMKGLTPTEAANLTAWICGLSTSDPRWSLKQINQLLFLRAMRQSGRFGGDDGARKRPH